MNEDKLREAWNKAIDSDIEGGIYDQITAKYLEDGMCVSDLFDVGELGFTAGAEARDEEVQRLEKENNRLEQQYKIDIVIIESWMESDQKHRAKNKKLREALKFILDECDWEQGNNHGGCDMCTVSGDNRIGESIIQALKDGE